MDAWRVGGGRAESCNLFDAEKVAQVVHPSTDTLLRRYHEPVWLRHLDICSFWLLSHFHTVAYAGIAANIISFDTKRAKTTSRRRFAALERADKEMVRSKALTDTNIHTALHFCAGLTHLTSIDLSVQHSNPTYNRYLLMLDCTIDLNWSVGPAQQPKVLQIFVLVNAFDC